jgi:putative holliday junction resolvase
MTLFSFLDFLRIHPIKELNDRVKVPPFMFEARGVDKQRCMSDKRFMRTMGLDIGSRTIGVAISDELGITAQGLKTIKRKSYEDDVDEMTRIIRQFEVEKIVVGLPRNMDGTLGKQADLIFKWIKSIHKRLSLPIVTWDERLTTVGASKILLEADLSRKKRKGVIDKIAAVLILQGYLDQMRNRRDEAHLSF